MSEFEIAKLYAVEGSIDRPVSELKSGASAEVAVQFNPSSLRVALSNSLKENERSGNSRSAQFVDKSSSTLTVELIFDTTDQFTGEDDEKRKDVRALTGAIAQAFMASNARAEGESSPEDQAPHRCMFAWGSFAFIGIMESFDETLDFFSSEGTPLRATVSIKMSESRYEFRSDEAKDAARNTPTLSPAAESMNDASWRDNALFNGVESPRAPGSDSLSNPGLSAGASLGLSAGISGGFSAGIGGGISAGIGGGIGGGISGGIGASAGIGISGGASIGGSLGASASISSPSFKFGASSSIGTSIPGAFSLNTKNGGGFSAGSIIASGKSSASASFSASASASASAGFSTSASASAGGKASASLGFD